MRSNLVVAVSVLTLLLAAACSQETAPAKPEQPSEQSENAISHGASQVAEGLGKIAEGTSEVVAETVKKAGEEAVEAKDQAVAVKDQVVTAGKEAASTVAQTVEEVKEEVKAAVNAPGVVTYDASQGQVTFDHSAHVQNFACDSCHTTDPPQKIAIDKATAHELCRGCHREKGGNAPTSCSGCHKK